MPELYAVAVVVDPVFGERLFSIAARRPVWIADPPKNRSAGEQQRARHPGQSGTEGVTTFKVDPDANSEDWCAQVLTNVDLHLCTPVLGVRIGIHFERGNSEDWC